MSRSSHGETPFALAMNRLRIAGGRSVAAKRVLLVIVQQLLEFMEVVKPAAHVGENPVAGLEPFERAETDGSQLWHRHDQRPDRRVQRRGQCLDGSDTRLGSASLDVPVRRQRDAGSLRNCGIAVAKGVAALTKNKEVGDTWAQMQDSLQRVRQCPPEVWMVKQADRGRVSGKYPCPPQKDIVL